MISVIIPTCHRNDLLAKCLDCLAPGVQTLPADQYEVIVTDDGSKSTAEEIMRERYPWGQWIAGPRKGPAANRNNGAKFAQGEWLAFTDDDCLPEPGWLQAFVTVSDGSALALEGAIYPVGNIDQDLAECPVNTTGGHFWSANIAVRHDLFDKVCGFDINYSFAAHEDQDLKMRLAPLSKILFVAEARVFHPVRVLELKKLLQQMPSRCFAFAYHAKKHSVMFGNGNGFQFLSSQYIFHLRSLKRSVIRCNPKSVIWSLITLLIGVPMNYIYLRRITLS